MSWLAQMTRVMAWLQASAQGQQLLALGAELDGLVQPAVGHPDVAIQINSQPMRHQEVAAAPAGQHLSSILFICTAC